MPSLGDIVVLTHDAIGAPRNKVSYPRLDTEGTPGAGVGLESPRGADGLHDVAVAGFRFCPAKPSGQALHVEWLRLFALTLSGPITPGHRYP